MIRVMVPVICLTALLLAEPLGAQDAFVLSHGGRIEGQLLNPDEQPRVEYMVGTVGGIVSFPAEQVEEVIRRSEQEHRYELLLPRMPPTADGNWKMAEWCRSNGLTEQRTFHLRQVLEYDADHEQARRALGYGRIDDEWVHPDEFKEQRGYVRHRGGAWRLPQEIELIEQANESGNQDRQWRRQLNTWRNQIVRGRTGSDEAFRNLKLLDDPMAAPGLVNMIQREDVPEMKLLLIETLGRLNTGSGARTFVELALHDEDRSVREKALDQLEAQGGPAAVSLLVRALGDRNNRTVNRAAVALGRIGDPQATLPLIEALTTKHRFVVNTGGNMNVGFGDGGSTFTTGGGPRILERELRNDEVLTALMSIHEGVNYRFDKSAWKSWFARQGVPRSFNLRRDP